MRATPYASLLAFFLTFPLNHLLVSPAYPDISMGFHGAPVVYSIVSWCNAAFLYGYARWWSGVWKKSWTGIDPKRVLTRAGFAALLLLGLPGVLQVGAEWWAWEASSVMSGWLGTKALAAQSVLITVTTVTYCIPLGLSVAASVRVGNHLGAGKAGRARAATLASLGLAAAFGLANAGFLFATRDKWGPLLTSDEKVSKKVAETLPLAALFQVNDGFSVVGGGAMRGCGYQGLGAAYAVLGLYVLGLPLGYWLAFKRKWFGDGEDEENGGKKIEGEGLKGLWRGLLLGLFAMSLLQTRFVLRINMSKEVQRARARLKGKTVLPKVVV
jgi:MATE family multidrug resistance protein